MGDSSKGLRSYRDDIDRILLSFPAEVSAELKEWRAKERGRKRGKVRLKSLFFAFFIFLFGLFLLLEWEYFLFRNSYSLLKDFSKEYKKVLALRIESTSSFFKYGPRLRRWLVEGRSSLRSAVEKVCSLDSWGGSSGGFGAGFWALFRKVKLAYIYQRNKELFSKFRGEKICERNFRLRLRTLLKKERNLLLHFLNYSRRRVLEMIASTKPMSGEYWRRAAEYFAIYSEALAFLRELRGDALCGKSCRKLLADSLKLKLAGREPRKISVLWPYFGDFPNYLKDYFRDFYPVKSEKYLLLPALRVTGHLKVERFPLWFLLLRRGELNYFLPLPSYETDVDVAPRYSRKNVFLLPKRYLRYLDFEEKERLLAVANSHRIYPSSIAGNCSLLSKSDSGDILYFFQLEDNVFSAVKRVYSPRTVLSLRFVSGREGELAVTSLAGDPESVDSYQQRATVWLVKTFGGGRALELSKKLWTTPQKSIDLIAGASSDSDTEVAFWRYLCGEKNLGYFGIFHGGQPHLFDLKLKGTLDSFSLSGERLAVLFTPAAGGQSLNFYRLERDAADVRLVAHKSVKLGAGRKYKYLLPYQKGFIAVGKRASVKIHWDGKVSAPLGSLAGRWRGTIAGELLVGVESWSLAEGGRPYFENLFVRTLPKGTLFSKDRVNE